jgi:hypothetical protein
VFERDDDLIARVVDQLRRPVAIDAGLDARVMETVSRLPAPRRAPGPARTAWRWLIRPRTFTLSPLSGLAIAAGLAALVLALPRRPPGPVASHGETRSFEFVVAAPHAARVALVGDFNDWDAARTPMRRSDQAGSVWTAVLTLSPGRYRYGFLVDGATWLGDPAAPSDHDDEFGTASSVVTVGGGGGGS